MSELNRKQEFINNDGSGSSESSSRLKTRGARQAGRFFGLGRFMRAAKSMAARTLSGKYYSTLRYFEVVPIDFSYILQRLKLEGSH